MAVQTYVWDHQSRTPQGVRGLKWHRMDHLGGLIRKSRPARGAWIEMALLLPMHGFSGVAPRKGCVD